MSTNPTEKKVTDCAHCAERAKEINPRPVWQCPRCLLVWITELCSLQDGHRPGWRRTMQREFGQNFRYVISRP